MIIMAGGRVGGGTGQLGSFVRLFANQAGQGKI